MRSRAWSIACLVAIVGIAACSGTSPATGSPTGAGGGGGGTVSDPCSLLTQAEVSAVVGQPVGPGTKDIEPKECDWQYPADAVPSIQVSITTETGNTLADLCGPGSSALGLTVTAVSGVGDGACFETLAGLGAGTNLTFAKGGNVFTVATVLGPNATPDAILAADKALALAAIGHLG
jgi:hypothetical protein